jgi:hypothetical protein
MQERIARREPTSRRRLENRSSLYPIFRSGFLQEIHVIELLCTQRKLAPMSHKEIDKRVHSFVLFVPFKFEKDSK